MITYNKIGHYGRLGNQLFQFAATYGIAKKLGYNVKFPKENINTAVTEHFTDGITRHITFDVPKVFKLNDDLLDCVDNINIEYEAQERFFEFDPGLFSIPDNCNLTGYYQTEKYFIHVEHEIRELLTFNSTIQETANSLFPTVPGSTISLHVRRGDYVTLSQYHPPCTPEYYISAANEFIHDNPYFIIFSDDIDYCHGLFGESENILYINNKDPFIDLCLMSMCDHNIIANSSFSWWAAWLNKNVNKKVIAPKKWFGSAYTHNTADLYCKDWIIL